MTDTPEIIRAKREGYVRCWREMARADTVDLRRRSEDCAAKAFPMPTVRRPRVIVIQGDSAPIAVAYHEGQWYTASAMDRTFPLGLEPNGGWLGRGDRWSPTPRNAADARVVADLWESPDHDVPGDA